jgi:CubicO group peptidase (beta-lactamase class C family)
MPVDAALDQLVASDGITALRVLHHGEVVHTAGPQDVPMPIHSMRKSFVSAMFGQLVDEGLRLDTTLSDFGIDDSPELTSIEKSATLEDLLTSSSGVYLPLRLDTSFDVFTNAPTNWPTRGSSTPGTRFFYNNWDFNVLGEIYQRVSGTALFVAFDRLLAQPLGFRDWDVLKHSHLRYGYDPLGATTRFPNYAMELSTRDLAAFGQLYLDEGCLRGDQLLSPEWVRRSTRPVVQTDLPQPFAHYGYLWWVSAGGDCSLPTNSFSAVGLGGQSLSIVPSHELVIVAMNDAGEASSSQMGISEAVMRAILGDS